MQLLFIIAAVMIVAFGVVRLQRPPAATPTERIAPTAVVDLASLPPPAHPPIEDPPAPITTTPWRTTSHPTPKAAAGKTNAITAVARAAEVRAPLPLSPPTPPPAPPSPEWRDRLEKLDRTRSFPLIDGGN